METTTNKTQTVQGSEDTKGFLRRISKPDASLEDVDKLKKMLIETPTMASLAGNLADRTRTKTLEQITSIPLIKESTKVYMDQMKDELGWQDASMLERLLIETIVNCWLQYYHATMQFSFATDRSHSITEGKYLDERVGLAHKRFLRSIESLAKVRKLLNTTPLSTLVDYDPIAFSSNHSVVME